MRNLITILGILLISINIFAQSKGTIKGESTYQQDSNEWIDKESGYKTITFTIKDINNGLDKKIRMYLYDGVAGYTTELTVMSIKGPTEEKEYTTITAFSQIAGVIEIVYNGQAFSLSYNYGSKSNGKKGYTKQIFGKLEL